MELSPATLCLFKEHLESEEKSKNTVQKYRHDAEIFLIFLQGRQVSKEMTLAYKERLIGLYAISSVNSMLAALNAFLDFLGLADCKVKPLKMQRRLFTREEKELSCGEYEKIIALGQRKKQDRLCMVIQTLCNTGIRISELPFITAEAVRAGRVTVNCKGKVREIFIHHQLQKLLMEYIEKNGIQTGSVFVTRNGKPIDRSNLWREMKELSKKANIEKGKVFPHNLRHLFARTYYKLKKDIVKLADILGHSNIQTTRIYTMTSGNEYRRELAGLGLLVS